MQVRETKVIYWAGNISFYRALKYLCSYIALYSSWHGSEAMNTALVLKPNVSDVHSIPEFYYKFSQERFISALVPLGMQ